VGAPSLLVFRNKVGIIIITTQSNMLHLGPFMTFEYDEFTYA
jgi:hypothetical protein